MSLYHAKLSYWKFSTRIDCKYSNNNNNNKKKNSRSVLGRFLERSLGLLRALKNYGERG